MKSSRPRSGITSRFTRRQLVAGGAVLGVAAAGAAVFGGVKWRRRRYTRSLAAPLKLEEGKTDSIRLVAAERPTALPCFGGRRLPMWTFSDGAWPPVIHLKLGEKLDVTLENNLPRPDETTSIHWHGSRLPNNQDGVPYLVQEPVPPGESFRYTFMPPDTGTFFFHTHCNTVEQLGRGLQGVLIVDGDTTEPYDADEVLFIRDWQVDGVAAEFNPFFTLRGAGRAGTYGTLRTVNGVVNPQIKLPAAGDCRLRLINGDPTRVMRLSIEDGEAAIIALDGFAIPPVELSTWVLGPAMRIDLVLRAPQNGAVAKLIDNAGSPNRAELAHFVGTGEPRTAAEFDPAPLHAVRITPPDLANATRMSFTFQASETGKFVSRPEESLGSPIGPLCLSAQNFWTVNSRGWPDRDHKRLPPPLAYLDRNGSYIFTLKNTTSFAHPIHIHGHTFKLLSSDKLERPEHHTDTLLLMPEETAEVAFVADNPGDWMFHCHVIEHQETGMMSYLRIT
jgi:FtsP/CotA-like multicopper oxidase with cupredoxin domain